MIIGIIGAMKDETQLIEKLLVGQEKLSCGGMEVVRGKYKNHTVILCTCGVGKTLAAAATQLIITVFGCETVINTGIAGNTDSCLGVGDVVIGKKLVFHDADMTVASHYFPFTDCFCSDAGLVEKVEKICGELGVKYKTACIATGDVFVCDSQVKKDIVSRTCCSCVEMEGAAIANIAVRNGVPFLVLRVMSDNADEDIAYQKYALELPIGEYCELSAEMMKRLLDRI